MTTVMTERLDKAIAEAGGDTRLALDTALMDHDMTTVLLAKEQERSKMLLDALETIRQLAWMYGPPPAPMKTIDKIAREVLRASGEIAMTTEED